MNGRRIGIWLIGAWGQIGTALAVVLAGLHSRTIATDGLVTEQPEFAGLDLAEWSRFVLGGHEIRKTSSTVEARNLFVKSKTVTAKRLAELEPAMNDWDRNVRTGTLLNSGPAIESRASTATLKTRGERPSAAVRRIAVDLEECRTVASLEHLIVVNVSSVDPPMQTCGSLSCRELLESLERSELSPVSTSVLYAAAALQSGCSYLNWTKSTGPHLPALEELAREKSALYMGREGRIDLVSIGLLNTAAEDDRLRSASALLDVARLCEREHRRGVSGAMTFLSSFFERPLGNPPDDVAAQRALLYDWARRVSSTG
jgi:myo-inositol-1-phosphate synthase